MEFNNRRILYRNLSFLMVVLLFISMFLTVRNERGQQFVDIAGDFSVFFMVLFSTLWMKRQGLYLCLFLSIIYLNSNLLISPIISPLSSIETIQNLRNFNLWIIASILVIYLLSGPYKSPIGFLGKEYRIKDYLIIIPTIVIIVGAQLAVRLF